MRDPSHFYYASIRSLSLEAQFRYFFFDIGGAISASLPRRKPCLDAGLSQRRPVSTQAHCGDLGQGAAVSVGPIWHACIAIRLAKHRSLLPTYTISFSLFGEDCGSAISGLATFLICGGRSVGGRDAHVCNMVGEGVITHALFKRRGAEFTIETVFHHFTKKHWVESNHGFVP